MIITMRCFGEGRNEGLHIKNRHLLTVEIMIMVWCRYRWGSLSAVGKKQRQNTHTHTATQTSNYQRGVWCVQCGNKILARQRQKWSLSCTTQFNRDTGTRKATLKNIQREDSESTRRLKIQDSKWWKSFRDYRGQFSSTFVKFTSGCFE